MLSNRSLIGRRRYHLRPNLEAENNLDPDYGNYILCAACRLPIFSTPFTTTLHDQCANHLLPAKLEAHPLHPRGDLILHHQSTTSIISSPSSCSRCGSICGTSFYKCPSPPPPPPDDDDQDDDDDDKDDDDDDQDDDDDDEDDDDDDEDEDEDDHDDKCDFQLDLACALPIRILHRSHHHRLTAIKGKSISSFSCAACGTQHQKQQQQQQQPPRILKPRAGRILIKPRQMIRDAAVNTGSVPDRWQVSYVCSPCDVWIHPDCALLPNAIVIDNKRHPHPLLLTYLDQDREKGKCAICDRRYGRFDGLGVYACFQCGYSAHIKCVIYSYPDHIHFKPVNILDAQVPDLLRLPMSNESTSVMSHIFTKKVVTNGGACSNICSTSGGGGGGGGGDQMSNDNIHEHPLILRGSDDDINNQLPAVAHVCNACVQIISPSDPFYNCIFNNNDDELAASRCGDFFLHRCCAHLPTTLPSTQHTTHYDNNDDDHKHPLTLISKPHIPHHPFNMFICGGCFNQCNGFVYACEECDYYLDVVCAFMHTSITYDGHANSHILRPVPIHVKSTKCICCVGAIDRWSEIAYECNSCRYFKIHAKCALLPDTVTHKFDRHPLKLIVTKAPNTDDRLVRGEQMFCEICEKDIDNTRIWYYGCKECEQYFHTNCIPCLDELSKIKFGFTVRVRCHDCQLTCVRALSVDGYRCQCGHCERKIITESDEIAFECSKCYFRIRRECAVRETMLLCQEVD